MFKTMIFSLFLVIYCVGGGIAFDPDADGVSINSINSSNSTMDDAVKEVMGKECRGGYSPFCFKLGIMKLVGRGGGISMPILPGVVLTSTGLPQSAASPEALINEPDKIDTILVERLSDYLSSLSLNVKIMDKKTPIQFAKAYLGDSNVATGRRKNKYGGALVAAGLMSGGTMLAVGMAALAAMAGKALMASLLALLLAGIAALGKGGGDDGKTTYEVIAKPVVSHHNTHSSEVVHGHGHHYRRSFDPQSLVYAKNILT